MVLIRRTLSNCLIRLHANATRVARCHIFKPKIPIWVNFGGPDNGRCWYILWRFSLFCGNLVSYVDFYGHFISFFPVLVYCTERNLATPNSTGNRRFVLTSGLNRNGINLFILVRFLSRTCEIGLAFQSGQLVELFTFFITEVAQILRCFFRQKNALLFFILKWVGLYIFCAFFTTSSGHPEYY
jgi:hypothetical protein